jgi:hypothetical protein
MDVLRWKQRRLRTVVAGALLASGMTALAAEPHRAAILLPPVKVEAGDMPIARGAMDDGPIGSTPVVRKKSATTANTPAWLSGVDPNVLPASGIFPNKTASSEVKTLGELPPLTSPKMPATSMTPSRESTPTFPRLEKAKLPGLGGQPDLPPDPNMPLKGRATNGAPLMAGPPAYRWYGYGAVTPGSNVYAPAGQYPKASSNWYGVTGATPGAFPVPVVAPYRAAPGSEPPSYVTNTKPPAMPAPIITETKPSLPVMTPAPVPPPSGVRPPAQLLPQPRKLENKPESKFPGVPAMPPIGSIGTGSLPPQLSLPPLPQPVGVTTPAGLMSEAPAVPPKSEKVESVVIPPVIPAAPPVLPPVEKKPVLGQPVTHVKPALEPLPTIPAAPQSLPPAVTEDHTWKKTETKPATPGDWTPAVPPVIPPPDLFLNPGAKVNTEPVARGQAPTEVDPVVGFIQGMCRGRAEGVDVRWAGAKKLMVCFESRSQQDGTRLVKEISARSELAPYAIDFCVLVK